MWRRFSASKAPVWSRLGSASTAPLGQIYSFHSGIANILLADGSVRSIRENIDAAVIAALVTRANSDVTPAQY